MILTVNDIDEFEINWRACQPAHDPEQLRLFLGWLAENPQVFMASGVQEFLAPHRSDSFRFLVDLGVIENDRPLFREFEGSWYYINSVGETTRQPWDGYRLEQVCAYYEDLVERHPSMPPSEAAYDAALGSIEMLSTYEDIMHIAAKYVDNPLADPTAFVSPRLWTPGHQESQRIHLKDSATEIIRSIQEERTTLADIHWRTFEDIVAEILRSHGCEIHRVAEHPQGGRDIIARTKTELWGEILTIAVEVKHKDTVDRPEVQTALEQNEHFAALMFVTSGSFTTGVMKEAAKSTRRLRLFLKDGVAIRDMIKRYPLYKKS